MRRMSPESSARTSVAFELDAARGRLDEPQDAASDGRLARSRFADQAERLAAADAEADAVDRFDLRDDAREDAALDREVLVEIADDEERLADAERGSASARSAVSPDAEC